MNGTGSTPTTPQTSSTSQPGAYDAAEHAEHLKGTYGLPGIEQEPDTHFDFLKRPLKLGDKVVKGVGGRSGGLSGPYTIHGFTPKKVRLSPDKGVYTVLPANLVKVSE